MTRPSTGSITSTHRLVPLRGRITKLVATGCISRLLLLASESHEQPVVMEIDTPGGLAKESILILSTMRGMKCPIVTFCRGMVGGTAAIIAAHGSPGMRVGLPTARFSFQSLRNESPLTPARRQLLSEMLAERTGRPVAETLSWLLETPDFSAEEACSKGLIDAVQTEWSMPGPMQQR